MEEVKVPKYHLIENDILDKINSGIYEADTALPSEAELSAMYNCSRVTVRQALGNLAYKGFIKKIQGSGAYVNRPKLIQRNPFIKSFSEDMEEQGKKPRTTVNAFSVIPAGKQVASLLGIEDTDPIYYIERTRFADDDALMYERTYMAVALHPDISMKILQGSKHRYAEEHGLNIEYASQNITPIFAPDYIAEALKISTKQPILKVANTTYIKDGRVFDHTELFLHPELYQLNMIKYKDS